MLSPQGNLWKLTMKRLIVITCCLSMFFAGLASAWANCKQIYASADDHRSSAHDHHSDSHHQHSDGSRVHCAIFKDYVPSAVISAKPDRKPERVVNEFVTELVFYIPDGGFYRLIQGSPAISQANGIPYHIFLSVFRI
jgi:hypothetical protein